MWCKTCNKIVYDKVCPTCGNVAQEDIPTEVFWCDHCNVPLIKEVVDVDKDSCPLCGGKTKYLCTDLRPVFPEERLLIELLIGTPFAWLGKAVWANNNRYYINGKVKVISNSEFANADVHEVIGQLAECKEKNNYDYFYSNIETFNKANSSRYTLLQANIKNPRK